MPVISFTDTTGQLVIIDAEYFTTDQEQAILSQARPEVQQQLNDLFTRLRLDTRRLDAAASAEQRAIGWGDYFAVRWDGDTGQGLVFPPEPVTIYGRVAVREQVARTEPPEVVAQIDAMYGQGWRHIQAYSRNEPQGEIGDQHIARMIPITREQFAAALQRGWPSEIPGQ